MKRYTQDALVALKEARISNPGVSQRKMARNIFALVDPNYRYSDTLSAPTNQNTVALSTKLGNPSEVALAHLIRKADKQISVENAQRIAGGSTGTRTRK